MLADSTTITQFIPQRPPFVMIDNLISASIENGFKSSFEVRPDNVLLLENGLSEGALVENVAQTCAAGFGYVNSQAGEGGGQMGFIGSVSRLEVKGVAPVHAVVETNVEIISTFDKIHLIEGKVSLNGEELLSCQMKIVIP